MKKVILPLALSALMLMSCSGGGEQPSNTSQGGGTTSTTQIEIDPQTTFLNAKKASMENTTYEYDYEANTSIKFKGALEASLGKINGRVQWNKNAPETQYMSQRTLSGLLLIDSTSYKYNVGTDLIKLNADENKDFSIVEHEAISTGYDFETNSIGRLLKTLETNGFVKVTKDREKYNIDLKTNFAHDSFLSVLNYIDSQKIVNTLSKIAKNKWDVSFGYECYATLTSDNSKVKTFHFAVNVNAKDIVDIGFSFDQTFTSYAGDISIVIPRFENTYTTTNQIDTQLSDLKSKFAIAKDKYYKYDLKTAIDHGVSRENVFGLAVNSHSQGYAERSNIGEDIFFHNGLELDSDYKNKDQYPDICDDYKFTRAKLNNTNKDVYDVKDGLVNTYNLISNYDNDAVDDYYMLIDENWLSSSTVRILRKTTDKESNTIYKLGIGESGVQSIFDRYNKHIRLSSDPKKQHINVYEIYNGLNTRKADFLATVDANGKLVEIDILLKGFYNMAEDDDVKFKLDLKIEFDHDHAAYKIPVDKKDIELPNF